MRTRASHPCCFEAILQARTREHLLRAACQDAVETMGVDVAWIGLVGQDAHPLRPVACFGPAAGVIDFFGNPSGDALAATSDTAGQPGAQAVLPVLQAVQEGRPYVCSDMQREPHLPWRDAAHQHGLRAYAGFPLVHGEEVLGVLHVCSAEAGAFDREGAAPFAHLARSVAAAAERMRTEQALAECQADLRRAEEAARMGSWRFDFPSGRLRWSEQAYRIFGCPPGTVHTSEDFLARVHPDDRARVVAARAAAVAGTAPYDIEHRILIGEEVRWIQETAELIYDDEGQLLAALGTAQDITGRKRAIDEISRSNRLLQALSQAQSRFIVESDPRSTFEEMVRILLDLTGSEYGFFGEVYRSSEGHPYIQTHALAYTPEAKEIAAYAANYPEPPALHKLDTLFGAVLTTGEAVIANRPASDPRSGGLPPGHPPLNAFLGLPFKHGGTVLGMACVANRPGGYDQDLVRYLEPYQTTCASLVAAYRNERRRQRAEEDLRLLNAELEQRVAARTAELQQTNQELEAFTYTVAHDLKSPLRSIDGYSSLLLDEHAARLDQEGQQFLDKVRRATRRMGQLIDDLLAYSRIERRSLSRAPFDMRGLIDELQAERSQELGARGVVVRVDLPWDIMEADREGLAMALRNLLENALKFTRDVAAPQIEIGGRQTDTARVLWVRDNGCGFDMRYHDRIFEIFHRLHRLDEYPGTGVGLALVRKAVQRMGGRAWAESRVGEGAVFYLELPQRA